MERWRRRVNSADSGSARRILKTPISFAFFQRRPLSAAIVLILHALAVYVLLADLPSPIRQESAPELIVAIMPGGPREPRGAVPLPALIAPDELRAPPPELSLDIHPENSLPAANATGGAGVTIPAEAIGTTRSIPVLPVNLAAIARQALLRLRLIVATDGSISDAFVETSTGSPEVDRLALAWVKMHWRYRPAMRDGVAISVTTTSLVFF